MGFRSVYRVLQEVFPEVDSRALRAVAIEHSKDADAAVEVVLVEVIPFLSQKSTPTLPSNGSGINPPEAVVVDADTVARTDAAAPVDSSCLNDSVNEGGHGGDADDEFISLEESEESRNVSIDMSSNVTVTTQGCENGADGDHDEACRKSTSIEFISLEKCEDNSNEVAGFCPSSHVIAKHGDDGANASMTGHPNADWKDMKQPADCNINLAVHGASPGEQLCIHVNALEMAASPEEQLCIHVNALEMGNSAVQLAPSPVERCITNAPESSSQSVAMPNMLITGLEKPEPSGAFKEGMPTTEVVALEDDFTVNTVVTRSGQICSIDILEEIIEDARSNKKTLLSAMDSVITLMKEVELQEKAAEQAKEEAAQGGLDILCKVEELKQQLRLAKEANDMHAGEVYGEKAILGTEVRELQTRLLSLSDKRDKSLSILDEMRQTLEVRLTAAEKEMKVAEQEKLGKEESARNLLNHQNGIMEKVVQESKILKQAAEENSKLRDFLIDRGRVVDMLQGEILVKCQDVKLLKERFDERIPLGKFLSASQTSSILASSSSSLRSSEPDQVSKVAESSENPKKMSRTPSSDYPLSSEDERTKNHSDRFFAGGDERARDDSKVIAAGDGWELFGNEGAGDEGKETAADDGWELFRNEALSVDGWELFDNRDYYK